MARCAYVTAARMQCLLDEGHLSGHDVLGDQVVAVAEGKCLSSCLPAEDCRSCEVTSYPNLCGRRIATQGGGEASARR